MHTRTLPRDPETKAREHVYLDDRYKFTVRRSFMLLDQNTDIWFTVRTIQEALDKNYKQKLKRHCQGKATT